ncbi:hypothetical protein D3C87_1227100 [compost metagenome]
MHRPAVCADRGQAGAGADAAPLRLPRPVRLPVQAQGNADDQARQPRAARAAAPAARAHRGPARGGGGHARRAGRGTGPRAGADRAVRVEPGHRARAGRADPRRGGRRRLCGEAAGSGRDRRRAAGVGHRGDRRRYLQRPRAGLGPPLRGDAGCGCRRARGGRLSRRWPPAGVARLWQFPMGDVSGLSAPRVRLLHGGRRRAAAGAWRSRWQRRLRPVRRTLAGPALAGLAGRWRGPGRGGQRRHRRGSPQSGGDPRRDAAGRHPGLHGAVEYRTRERSQRLVGLFAGGAAHLHARHPPATAARRDLPDRRSPGRLAAERRHAGGGAVRTARPRRERHGHALRPAGHWARPADWPAAAAAAVADTLC